MRRTFCVMLAVLCGACGLFPERVAFDDPRVQQLLRATRRVDRAAMGFTPVDRTFELRLERVPRAGYDAMLHVDGKTHAAH